MVTVVSRPLGHKLGTTLFDATVSNNSGVAQVTTVLPHGLTTGNYVFIDSDFDSYNGYKFVHVVSSTAFKISDSENGDLSPFKQIASIGYYKSELDHGYSSVHLPIVYELHSDKFPNNELDETYSTRVVSSFVNSNGYTQLNLSVDLYDYRKLDFIILKGDGPLAGPYQIVNSVDANSPIINLAYKSINDFSPYVVEQYYNNYYIGVNVYSGLDVDHRWVVEKPFKLVATLKFVPDDNGNVKFSVSEILKTDIITRNNLSLDTLPNNLDFFTEFYISYFEGYDVSDNVNITAFVSDSVTDSFIGQAINSQTEFKSIDAGFLSDYINSSLTPGRFLTIQERPQIYVGYFFDMSFINTLNGVNVLVTVNKKFEGYIFSTEVITLENPGKGILRLPIDAENGYDEYCIQARTPDSTVTIVIPPATFDLSTFIQSGAGQNWMISSMPRFTNAGGSASKDLYISFPTISGNDYAFTVYFTVFVNSNTITFALIDSVSDVSAIIHTESALAPGNYTRSFTIHSTSNKALFSVEIDANFVGSDIRINSITHGTSTTETITVPGTILTEQFCMDVVDECNTFADGNARLLEDGNIRIIE